MLRIAPGRSRCALQAREGRGSRPYTTPRPTTRRSNTCVSFSGSLATVTTDTAHDMSAAMQAFPTGPLPWSLVLDKDNDGSDMGTPDGTSTKPIVRAKPPGKAGPVCPAGAGRTIGRAWLPVPAVEGGHLERGCRRHEPQRPFLWRDGIGCVKVGNEPPPAFAMQHQCTPRDAAGAGEVEADDGRVLVKDLDVKLLRIKAVVGRTSS